MRPSTVSPSDGRTVPELDPHREDRFRETIARFTTDLREGSGRPLLPAPAIAVAPRVLEMSFATGARATVSVGAQPGHAPNVVWRRIGRAAPRRVARA